MEDECTPIRWDKQVLLPDEQTIVRHSGSLAQGLQIESQAGTALIIEAPALAALLDRLRHYNPLLDGSHYYLGLSNHDLINQWLWEQAGRQPSRLSRLWYALAFRLGYCSHPDEQNPHVRRLHSVLAAEGLVPAIGTAALAQPEDLPGLSVLEAIEPFKGREVLVVDRRPFTLARLVAVTHGDPHGELIGSALLTRSDGVDGEQGSARRPDAAAPISFTFEALRAPGCDWDGPAMFSIGADPDVISLARGHLWVRGLGMSVVTAPELIRIAMQVAATVQDPRKRRAGIRDVISRRTRATVRPPSPY
jgi:hypothetical protein